MDKDKAAAYLARWRALHRRASISGLLVASRSYDGAAPKAKPLSPQAKPQHKHVQQARIAAKDLAKLAARSSCPKLERHSDDLPDRGSRPQSHGHDKGMLRQHRGNVFNSPHLYTRTVKRIRWD